MGASGVLRSGIHDNLGLPSYLCRASLGLDLIEFPQRKLMHLYRAGTVPRIMLLNEEGRILYSRTGALVDRNAIDSVLHAIAEPMK
jgi:hypothetical protein